METNIKALAIMTGLKILFTCAFPNALERLRTVAEKTTYCVMPYNNLPCCCRRLEFLSCESKYSCRGPIPLQSNVIAHSASHYLSAEGGVSMKRSSTNLSH
ncbi:hypothetical protein KC19_VG029800 [Ceratodon purpureus]|uniref:Uncharacterized protein n=1 Tax=Ceratodon purpureus TaxID=3225 RepID=A0A8T0HLF3_CERPU|nr:hypothetical protein KC19_VG029800 [Ceratodon purpureus]